MGLFERLKRNSNSYQKDVNIRDAANVIFFMIEEISPSFFKSDYIKIHDYQGAKYEVMLFICAEAINSLKYHFPESYYLVMNKIVKKFADYIFEKNIINRINQSPDVFVTNKLNFYAADIKKSQEERNWLMADTVKSIYLYPLSEDMLSDSRYKAELGEDEKIFLLFFYSILRPRNKQFLDSKIIELGNHLLR